MTYPLRNRLAVASAALLLATLPSLGCGKSGDKSGSGTEQGGAQGSGEAEAGKRTLVINANTSDTAPKAAMEGLIKAFEAAHPDIQVKLNISDHEGYKTQVRNFLTAQAPDIITWFAGNRMKTFVDLKLLEDVSDVWQKNGLAESMASSRSALTIDDKQYGVPYTTYQWGVYYRKDIFDEHGLTAPTTWEELLAVCKTLKEKGIAPFAIGTKFLWTAAGWFDYLDLRINGLDFHIELMEGKVPYTDDRVKAVLARWRELIGPGYYLENHASYSWQEAMPSLQQGKAGMYLLGNFLIGSLEESERSKYSYFPFPTIDPAVARYEDAPIDTLHIPAKAKNKADARTFLAFAATVEQQSAMNATLAQLPLHKDATIKAGDPFLAAGADVIRGAKGLAQFFDRDTDPEMAKVGMKGLQEFMVKPDREDAILERLEKARQRIFKKK